ncbi:MAG TPA: hypothetical protein PKO09_06690 [Anaerolineae bacterium]|nr:hypothetical protein [Anaerolineae bacterium]
MKARHTPGAAYLRGALLVALVALLALLAGPSRARSGSGYDLSWWSVDGGGETFVGGGMHSAGGSLSLSGTAGQADAGLHEGGAFVLAGGFEPGGAVFAPQRYLYLPLGLRGY